MTLQEMINKVGSNPTLESTLLKTVDSEKVFEDVYRVIGVEPSSFFTLINSVTGNIKYAINDTFITLAVEANVPTKVVVKEELINASHMFDNDGYLTSLDLSNLDTSKVTNMGYMFRSCISLTSLNLGNFDTSKVTKMDWVFYNCPSLIHIKCKQAFKDWCIANQDDIYLPNTMRNGGIGTWEIID